MGRIFLCTPKLWTLEDRVEDSLKTTLIPLHMEKKVRVKRLELKGKGLELRG